MKTRVLSVLAAMMLLLSGAAEARSVIIGTDIAALSDNIPNMFYQSRAFSHSALRISGASEPGGLTGGLGFRFYFDRYANSPYIQGEVLFGNTNDSGAKLGVDLGLGNLIIDPYLSTLNRSFGINIGLRL